MDSQNFWMIRAGIGGKLINEFREKNRIAIGWCNTFDLTRIADKNAIRDRVSQSYPDNSIHQNYAITGQMARFLQEMKPGDGIVTYDSAKRTYLIGTILSPPEFDTSQIDSMTNYRRVRWSDEVSRDSLSVSAKNSLGAIMTLFKIPPEITREILSQANEASLRLHTAMDPLSEEIEEQADLLSDIRSRSLEFIKDRVNKLNWEQMQILVADILTAMGYKTRISLPGSDRGKDIIASPDGFGFEQPRIVVEVKHRRGAMGAPEIRSFHGGRHKDDKGLYVSTGGFTKEARYESDRAPIPITLMDLDDLVMALIENYDNIRVSSRALVPLEKIYWPIEG